MENFQSLNLSPILARSLEKMNYATPTPIQAKAIPLALEGNDIMGSAQTGTGKTAAFAIPLVERLLRNPEGSALVLTPTRELGKQIMTIMHQLLGEEKSIKTAFIIGGEPMGKQFDQLRRNPRLIVGTPGRINDHLDRGTLNLSDTDFLVLDETDRMLDMGFTIQLESIFEFMPEERQTLMFSATLPDNILSMSKKYLHNPKRVAVGEVNVIAQNIEQEAIRIEQPEKYKELINQLNQREGSVIVFVKTKFGADRIATNLRKDGFTSEALHGDLRQNKRDKVMQNFRKQNFRILIATDIAARGLDVPHIEHVINYDLPQVAEDFIHRMGRTARAGATGSAISFVSNQEWRQWHAIEMLINPDAVSNDRYASNSNRKKPAGKNFRSKKFDDKKFGGKKFEGKKSEGRSFEGKKFEGKKSEGRSFEGKKFDDRKSEGRSFEGKKFEGKKSEGRSFEGKKFDDRKSEGRSFEGKKFEGKKSEGRSFEGKKFDDRKSEGRSFEGKKFDDRKSEGRSFEGKKFEGKKSEGRSFEGKKFEGKKSEGRSFEGKKFEGKKSEGRSFEGKKFEGKKSEGRSFEGKKFEGKKSEGRSFEGKKFEGKKSEGRSFEGKKPAGQKAEGGAFEKKKPSNFNAAGGKAYAKKPMKGTKASAAKKLAPKKAPMQSLGNQVRTRSK